MRKTLFPAALLLSLTVNAQIFSSGFENNNGTPLSAYTKINGDGLTVPDYASVQDFNTNAWIKFYDGYDNKIAFSTSWYAPEGKSNDWLITPAITIPDEASPTLYWKAKSYDFDKTDGYSVRISTSDNQAGSFGTELIHVDAEQPFDYASHSLSLAAYKGKTVYIAFVNDTTAGTYLALDDLYISKSDKCMMPDVDGISASNLTESSFTVNFPPTSGISSYDTGLTTFTVPVSSAGIQAAGSKDFANLQPATRYQFFLKNADCGSGWATPKSVWTAALPPYSYGFEPTEENYGEYDSDGWSSNSWISGAGTSAQNGDGYVFSNTSTSYAKNEWLYSYPIKLKTGEKIIIKYFAKMSSDAATTPTLKIAAASAPDKSSNLAEIASNPVSGSTYKEYSATYTAPSDGVYYFGFGNVNPKMPVSGTIRLDTISFTADSTMGTAENTVENSISIYPVPVRDILNIKSSEKIISTQLYDAAGSLIKSSKGSNKIDFGSYGRGIYLLKITTDKGSVVRKVIK